jgi:hypothetical protein
MLSQSEKLLDRRDARQIVPERHQSFQRPRASQRPQALADKLTGVEVRNFEFAQTGAYTEADVAPVRQQMARLMGDQKGCSKVIDSICCVTSLPLFRN